MINISDIRRRLQVNPEPTEVKRIRDLIISSYRDLEFFEEPHKYILHGPSGDTELPSVSSVIHRFEPPKDWDKIRINKAKREGIDPEVLKRQWRENNLTSTSNGTKTHFFLENVMNLWIYGESGLDQEVSHYQYEDGYMIPYGPKEAAGMKFYEEMVLKKPDIYPIMPEAKIYTGLTPEFSFKQEYCGTFDLLFGKRVPGTDKIVPFLADWKGLPLDTKVLTGRGFKELKDVTDQDYVYDRLGKPTRVLHVSEVHYNPCYRIIFNDGTDIVADKDHRWDICIGGPGNRRTLTTLEVLKMLESTEFKSDLIRIYAPDPIESLPVKLPEDPMCLGMSLGPGEPIPGQYLFGSIEQRFFLLIGMVIGASKDYPQNGFMRVPDRPGLETLLGSLGQTWSKVNGVIEFKSSFEKGGYRKIVSIEPTDTVPTKCLEVDSPTHTWLVTERLLVTHNTNKSLINDYARSKHQMMLPPFQDLYDEPLSHYTLQLSCYQMGIQQLGLPVTHRVIVWLKEDGTYELIPVPDVTDRLKLIL